MLGAQRPKAGTPCRPFVLYISYQYRFFIIVFLLIPIQIGSPMQSLSPHLHDSIVHETYKTYT